MPIYEFYCVSCNVVFSFLSRRVDTSCRPDCPRCGQKEMARQMSGFASPAVSRGSRNRGAAGIDESQLEKAFTGLMRAAEGSDEPSPEKMATLMHRFTTDSGLQLSDAMADAMARLEKGEDPDLIEKELGNSPDARELFSPDASLCNRSLSRDSDSPEHDEKLYEFQEGWPER